MMMKRTFRSRGWPWWVWRRIANRRARLAGGGGGEPALRNRPYRGMVYGDSFGQRSQTVLGTPSRDYLGVDNAGAVNPVAYLWPCELTNQVGGVAWGMAPWIQAVSQGKFVLPWQLNRAVGGSNTGQCSEYDSADDRLSQAIDVLAAEEAAGRSVDFVLVNLPVNDGVTAFTLANTTTNYRQIIDAFLAEKPSLKLILTTSSPRGLSTDTGDRITSDRVAVMEAVNNAIMVTLPGEYPGSVYPADIYTDAEDTPGGAVLDGDVKQNYTYDGLHTSTLGHQRVSVPKVLAALEAAFPDNVDDQLAASTSDPANLLGSVGLMQGTGGNIDLVGNAATNAGFTFNGSNVDQASVAAVPASWTLATNTGWNGTDPANAKGTVVASIVSADVGSAIQLVLTLDTSGKTTDNTLFMEAQTAVPLGDLTAGDWVEALMRVEIEDIAEFRGVDLEMRFVEPGAVTRTVRTIQAAPNGTALRELDPAIEYTGANALILRTAPWQIKAGTYGSITLAAVLAVAGDKASVTAKVKLSQATVRKSVFA